MYTRQGVAISVTGVAQVKVQSTNDDMLQSACQQFLGKTEAEMRRIAQETLEGHQRAIMGTMTVEVLLILCYVETEKILFCCCQHSFISLC